MNVYLELLFIPWHESVITIIILPGMYMAVPQHNYIYSCPAGHAIYKLSCPFRGHHNYVCVMPGSRDEDFKTNTLTIRSKSFD